MSPDRVHVSAAHRDDLAAIMALEGAGFPEVERWSERSWLGELLGEGRTVLMARAHAPVGVITVQTVGELADLHRLVVAPSYRRRGVGTQLTVAAVSAVRQLGARAMILEVHYTNDPAIALYGRVGFEQLTARENYYGPGRHALIMKLYDLDAWTAPEQKMS
jgi:[ribosomal protein S18]-alanine N-acetyltransferase